jgi:hypothetical protein
MSRTLCDSAWISSMASNRFPFSFSFTFVNSKKSRCQITGVRWVGVDSHFMFRQKLLGESGCMRRGIVMLKQPGLFSPKFVATSWHVFTQSPQNFVVEPVIHSLTCWDLCFALPQLLYEWGHQSGLFWKPPRIYYCLTYT